MPKRNVFLMFICAVVLFTIGLPDEFVGFQTRFGLFAKEMLHNGPTFFPTTYGNPYPDYPSLSTILIYLPALIYGKVTPFIAILPTAIISAAVLVMTYLLAATCSKRWGIFAVLFSLLTMIFLEQSRTISLDQFISILTLTSFYLVHSAAITGRNSRLAFLPLILIVGFALRGPIGIVMPAAVVSGYFLCQRRYKTLLITGVLTVTLMAICMVALLFAAKIDGGDSFVKEVMESQFSGRMQEANRPIFYYFFDSWGDYSISFPIAVLVVIAMRRRLLHPTSNEERLIANLVVWILVIMVGMSIPGTKNTRYILPISPAIAIIASYLFIMKADSKILKGIKSNLLGLFGHAPAIAAVASIIAYFWTSRIDLNPDLNIIILLAILFPLIFVPKMLKRKFSSPQTQEMLITATAAVAFITIYIGLIQPIYYSREHTTTFVTAIETLRQSNPGPLVFYKINPDNEDIKYASNAQNPIKPNYAKFTDEMLEYGESAFFVAPEKYYDTLPDDFVNNIIQITKGNIGHKKCIAFRLKKISDKQQ